MLRRDHATKDRRAARSFVPVNHQGALSTVALPRVAAYKIPRVPSKLFDSESPMFPLDDEEQPISILVDVVAKVISGRWNKLKEAHLTLDSSQRTFATLAYEYLTRRERGIYKLERENALDWARATYRRPSDLWEMKPRAFGDAVAAFFGALAALAAVAAGAALLMHLEQMITQLLTLLKDPRFYFLMSFWIVILLALSLTSRFAAHQTIEALAGHVPLNWRFYQPSSSNAARSERQTVLQMARSDQSDIPESSGLDADVRTADESPVPIQPGISEIVLSIDEDAITQIESDLMALRTQQITVFWGSFALFATCLVGSLLGGLFLGTKTALVGGAAVCSVIGTYSVYTLRNARRSAMAIVLFRSYLVELRGRLNSLAKMKSDARREELRRESWTEFRSGINRLWLLEGKSKKG